MGAIAAALAAWLFAALIYQSAAWVALARLLRRTEEPRDSPGPLPSCTILRPLRDAPPGAEELLRAIGALGASVIAGTESDVGPAAAVVRRVAGRLPPGRLTLNTGPAPSGSNRKVANLIRMLPEAKGEIVIFMDGDVGAPPSYLPAVLSPFADPRVGLVTCPYRSVGGRALSDRLDVLLTNTGFLPSVALAASLEGVKFALGATIAIRRSALDEIGGLEPFLDLLADDHALGSRVREAGHEIVLAPVLLDHHVGSSVWRERWRRHLRWARTTRAVRPGGYAGTIVTHGLVPAIGLALIPGGPLGGAAALAAWAAVRLGGVAWLSEPLGLRALDLLLIPAADAIAFAIFVGGLMGRTVHWGGLTLRVEGGALR